MTVIKTSENTPKKSRRATPMCVQAHIHPHCWADPSRFSVQNELDDFTIHAICGSPFQTDMENTCSDMFKSTSQNSSTVQNMFSSSQQLRRAHCRPDCPAQVQNKYNSLNLAIVSQLTHLTGFTFWVSIKPTMF